MEEPENSNWWQCIKYAFEKVRNEKGKSFNAALIKMIERYRIEAVRNR
jgi:hypothetical protein